MTNIRPYINAKIMKLKNQEGVSKLNGYSLNYDPFHYQNTKHSTPDI